MVRLPTAAKRYEKTCFHVWATGAGKHVWRFKEARKLIDGIAETIREPKHGQDPMTGKWLVVVHKKETTSCDVEAEVLKLLPVGTEDRVRFITWGCHDASNEFKDFENVILAGTWFKPADHYEALHRLCADIPSAEGKVSRKRVKNIELGEHANVILQAVCRGRIRQCHGGVAPQTHTYVIASKKSGIHDLLPEIFPGAKIGPWMSSPAERGRPLKGKVAEAAAFIRTALEGGETFIQFKDVMAGIGWKDPNDFRDDIRKREDFQAT
jgi:hypothetical protein